MKQAINIIFDGSPSHESGRFVEVETDDGKSINAGEWIDKGDGYWVLRIIDLPDSPPNNQMQIDKKPDCPYCEFWFGERKKFCPEYGKAFYD